MKRRFCAIAIAFLLCECVATDGLTKPQGEALTIPLDAIWAYQMPDTRPMTDIMAGEPLSYVPEEGAFVEAIRDALPHLRADRPVETKSGFAVPGTGMDALREVHRILTEKVEPSKSFPVGSELSAFFFAHQTRTFVHIQRVERRGQRIEIQYRFVPHWSDEMSEHFAISPLGKLPVGKYEVEIMQLPMEQTTRPSKPIRPELVNRIVCKPFSFSIVESEANK